MVTIPECSDHVQKWEHSADFRSAQKNMDPAELRRALNAEVSTFHRDNGISEFKHTETIVKTEAVSTAVCRSSIDLMCRISLEMPPGAGRCMAFIWKRPRLRLNGSCKTKEADTSSQG